MSEMTDYQKAVEKHMATAPQALSEYVRGRLKKSGFLCIKGITPIIMCGFDWDDSEEGNSFWSHIYTKRWKEAVSTDFWKKHTAPSQAPSERPKGVIGEWYTLTSDFEGYGYAKDRKAGYTWQCSHIDGHEEPMIDGLGIAHKESYRLATPEEIQKAQAKGEAPSIEFEKPEHEEYDFVNPAHYQQFSIEVIDMMAAIWGKEKTATHCEMCAFKYKLRAGSKPDQPIERDLEKAEWYLSKAKELRDA